MTKVKPNRFAPHQKYLDFEGNQYPGGSTIAKQLQESGPLVSWANKEGLEGRDCRKVVSNAADIGTIAHFMAECHVKGLEPDLSDFAASDIDKAENAFIRFLDFWQKGKYTLVHSEIQLVDPNERYGGTLDIVALCGDGHLTLIDLKTSKGIYGEHKIQVAGYADLFDHATVEMVNGRPVKRALPLMAIQRIAVLRIGKKEEGDFEVVWLDESARDYYWRGFQICRDAWEWKKEAW